MSAKKGRIEETREIGSPGQPAGSAEPDGNCATTANLIGGRYLIERKLGEGGMGVVYLGRDQLLHSRHVVIKVLLEESAKNEWLKRKFDQEPEALARINHRGVVGVLDAGQMPDGNPYLVMQYVEGTELRSVMTAEGMDFERASNILRQIGEALSAAHDKKVYHRDLKPENIMLQELGKGREQVTLIDFGIARVVNSEVAPARETTAIAGTVSYMAPEQFEGKPCAASDIYAFGVIAYEMLCGQRPFNPLNPYSTIELFEMQRAGVEVRPSDLHPNIPAAAEDAILKALAFDPRDRHERACDFGDEIARALTQTEPYKPQPDNPVVVIRGGDLKTTVAFPPQPNVVRRSLKPAVITVTALVAVTVVTLLLFVKGPVREEENPELKPMRELKYQIMWLKNPKTNPRAVASPLPSSGGSISEGDRIRIEVSSSQSGWLYILNEGPEPQYGAPLFTLTFPLPRNDQPSAEIASNEPVQIPKGRWLIMDDQEGTEKFWLVWSESMVPELETLKKWDTSQYGGEIRDAGEVEAAQAFLSKYPVSNVVAQMDDQLIQTNLKASGSVLVYPIKLAHRRRN